MLRRPHQLFVVKDVEGRIRTLRHPRAKAEELAKEIKADTQTWYWLWRPDMPEAELNRAIEMQVVPA